MNLKKNRIIITFFMTDLGCIIKVPVICPYKCVEYIFKKQKSLIENSLEEKLHLI